jgi:hypothetical protein
MSSASKHIQFDDLFNRLNRGKSTLSTAALGGAVMALVRAGIQTSAYVWI